MKDGYRVYNVSAEQYDNLALEADDIISSVKEGFNDYWKPKVECVPVSFVYEFGTIKIYIERDGERYDVGEIELTPVERGVALRLNLELRKKLGRWSPPSEKNPLKSYENMYVD